MLLQLAIKNIWRNKRRVIIIETSIIIGMLVIIFSAGLIKGMTYGMARRMVGQSVGAMQIEHINYEDQRKFKPLETTLTGSTDLIDRIERFPDITTAMGVLEIFGFISNGSKTTNFSGKGLEPLASRQVLTEKNSEIGHGRTLGISENEIVLGKKLAENLDLKVGDPVMLLARTMKGGLNMMDMVVVGIQSTAKMDYISATYIEINLSAAQKLMGMENRVSQIVVGHENFEGILKTAAIMRNDFADEGLADLRVKDYTDTVFGYKFLNQFFGSVANLVGIVLFLVVGAGIMNSFFMTVMERRKEIGTMRALGAERGYVRNVFVTEGFLISIIGVVAGVLLSILVIRIVSAAGGVPFGGAPGTSAAFSVKPILNHGTLIYAACLAMVIGTFASYLPARISGRLDPVTTLREE